MRAGKPRSKWPRAAASWSPSPVWSFPRPGCTASLRRPTPPGRPVCAARAFSAAKTIPGRLFPPVLTIPWTTFRPWRLSLPVFRRSLVRRPGAPGTAGEILRRCSSTRAALRHRQQLIAVGPWPAETNGSGRRCVIHRHYADRLTLARLTSASGMSQSQFRTSIRDIVGHPPSEYPHPLPHGRGPSCCAQTGQERGPGGLPEHLGLRPQVPGRGGRFARSWHPSRMNDADPPARAATDTGRRQKGERCPPLPACPAPLPGPLPRRLPPHSLSRRFPQNLHGPPILAAAVPGLGVACVASAGALPRLP